MFVKFDRELLDGELYLKIARRLDCRIPLSNKNNSWFLHTVWKFMYIPTALGTAIRLGGQSRQTCEMCSKLLLQMRWGQARFAWMPSKDLLESWITKSSPEYLCFTTMGIYTYFSCLTAKQSVKSCSKLLSRFRRGKQLACCLDGSLIDG